MRGKSWDVDEDAVLVRQGTHRGLHRNPRPRKTSRPRPGADTPFYWTAHHHRASEAARIAAAVFQSPSQMVSAELTPNHYFWRISNPNISTPETWDDIDRIVTRFFIEQGVNPLSGVRKCPHSQ